MTRAGLRIGACAAVALAGFMAAATASSAAEQRALLIGIGAYKNIRSLVGPPHDVARMEKFLTEHLGYRKDEIAILKDEKATRAGILGTAEQWLVNSTRPGDRVLIYYSGHGSQMPDKDGDEEDGFDETLAPHDTARNGANQVTDDEFGQLLDRLAGRDVTVIIDACHSGTIARGDIAAPADGTGDSVRTFVPELPATRGGGGDRSAHRKEESFVKTTGSRRVWSAAAANQFSWDSIDGGIFTKSFVEGAAARRADENGNGVVANAELLTYVRKQTASYCETNPRCKVLGFTPVLEADDRELANAIVPASTPEAPAQVEVTDVVVQDNPAQVDVKIIPGDTIKLGEEMRIEVTSERHGYLVLLDVNSKDEVTQLIPNEIMESHGRSREIFPGQPMTVPDAYYGIAFTAGEPVGEGTLLAIVTEDEDDLDNLLAANKAINVIEKPTEFVAGVAGKLMRIWKSGKQNRALRWSLGARKYRIVR